MSLSNNNIPSISFNSDLHKCINTSMSVPQWQILQVVLSQMAW